MLKRRICALLLAALLILAALPALASDETTLLKHGVDTIAGYEYIFTDGETLYLHADLGITLWRPGDAKPTYYAYVGPNMDYSFVTIPFCAEGTLYAVRARTTDDEDALESAVLYRMTLADGHAAFEEIGTVDWDDLVVDHQGMFFIPQPISVQSLGDKAYLLYSFSDQNGDQESRLAVVDLDRERAKVLDAEEYIQQIAPYKDNTLLLLTREPGEETADLRVYDPEQDESQRLAKLEIAPEDVLSGLAYDANADTIYVATGSQLRVVDTDAGALGDRLLELPSQLDFKNNATVLSNGLYAYCDGDVAVLNVKEQADEQIRLVICDPSNDSVLDSAIKDFQLLHPTAQLRVNRDQSRIDNLVENLVNQDDSVDIYLLDSTLSVYGSLLQRGFMLPLNDSAAITDCVGRLYPAIRDAITVNGKIMALPVSAEVTTVGLAAIPLKALGVDIAEVPNNWSDFLDLLASLEEPLKKTDGVRLCGDFNTALALRTQLFNAILRDYEACRLSGNDLVGYDTDLLRSLLEKLDKLDFVEMGVAEREDEAGSADYGLMFETENKNVVMDTKLDCAFNNLCLNLFTPNLMGLDADHPGALVMKLSVAVINPYSKNAKAAASFLETMVDSMSIRNRYCMMPELNTPIRGETYEHILQEYDELIETLRAQLEKTEGAARNLIQQKIDNQEEDKAYTLEHDWEISQRCIDWFRGNAENLSVAQPSWLDAEARSLMTAYCKGELSPGDMLKRIDQKVRMMQLEGN